MTLKNDLIRVAVSKAAAKQDLKPRSLAQLIEDLGSANWHHYGRFF